MCDIHFKPVQRNQSAFFAHKLVDLIPEHDLIFSIIKVVEKLDLSKMTVRYDSLGQNAFHPAMMLTILYYAYAMGIFSSRKIAEVVKYDIRFMYAASMYSISYNRINEFRKANWDLLKEYFIEIVKLCGDLGMLPPGFISIDGTKLHASASGKKSVDQEKLDKKIEMTQIEIDLLFRTIEEINDREEQLEWDYSPLQDQLDQLNKVKDGLLELKNKLQGEPQQLKINVTDPDCRQQKYIGPGYNAQAAVHAEYQIVVAADVVPDTNDFKQLQPMIEHIEENVKDFKKGYKVAADAGYSTTYNYQYLEERSHIDAYIPTREHQQDEDDAARSFTKSNFKFDLTTMIGTCPMGHPMSKQSESIRRGVKNIQFKGTACSFCPVKHLCTGAKRRTVRITTTDEYVRRMNRKMDSFGGKRAMEIRRGTVETVFGQLKGNLGFTRFSVRGQENVRSEFALLCSAHNLRKVHKFLQTEKFAGELSLKMLKTPFNDLNFYLLAIFFRFSF